MEQNNTNPSQKKGLSARTIVTIIILALLIGLPTGIYFWKQAALKCVKRQYEAQIVKINDGHANELAVIEKSRNEVLATVFSWAVRSEMMRSNLELVEQYMTELVKNQGYNEVSLVNPDGIVTKSTNKKYEGNIFPDLMASQLNAVSKVTFSDGPNGNVLVFAPIAGINERMATVIINYTPKNKTLTKSENDKK
jgi:hypothetical protein